MVTSIDTKSIARQFVDACDKEGIPVREAILFGSYAKGNADRNSDIDLALFQILLVIILLRIQNKLH